MLQLHAMACTHLQSMWALQQHPHLGSQSSWRLRPSQAEGSHPRLDSHDRPVMIQKTQKQRNALLRSFRVAMIELTVGPFLAKIVTPAAGMGFRESCLYSCQFLMTSILLSAISSGADSCPVVLR
eukprot:1146161-Pelagomonas_calceolata.AAC.5